MRGILPITAVLLLALGGLVRAENASSILGRYEHEDLVHPPPQGVTLFVGSSTIERWAWSNRLAVSFPGVPIVDRGVSGTTYRFLVEHVAALVFPSRPSRIVVYSGDNDVAERFPTARIVGDAATFLDRVRDKLPSSPVLLVSIKPSLELERRGFLPQVRRANAGLRALGETRPWLTFVDVASRMVDRRGRPRPELFDESGLHMNDRGYALWTEALRPMLMPGARPASP